MGFVREVDSVGRIVIPMQLRKEFNIVEQGSKVELFSDGKQIILKKAAYCCALCKAEAELLEIDGNYICKACLDKIKTIE